MTATNRTFFGILTTTEPYRVARIYVLVRFHFSTRFSHSADRFRCETDRQRKRHRQRERDGDGMRILPFVSQNLHKYICLLDTHQDQACSYFGCTCAYALNIVRQVLCLQHAFIFQHCTYSYLHNNHTFQ